MKKHKILMLLLLITGTMMYGKEPAGVLHTITLKKTNIFQKTKSVSIRIRSEGIKRIVSVPTKNTETMEVGYKDVNGKFYKKDGSTWDELQQYYNYVDTQNTYIESENGIIELEDVGYYEGEVILKERTIIIEELKDAELSSNADINIIVISENGTPKKIISFKDKYAIGEITQKQISDWIKWLKSSDKTENELFSKLSQRVYITLISENTYQGLYEEGGEYLREYFKISYENIKHDTDTAGNLKSKGATIVAQNISYSKNPINVLLRKGNNNKWIIKEILGIENDYDSLLEKGEIVPNLQDVKEGDIVAFKENGKSETGIVIKVSDEIEIAYIDATEGHAVTYNFEDIKNKADGKAFVVIRIVVEKQDIKNASWNVLEDEIKDVKINIGTMKESSQKSSEKHRWIPNTGEYLELSDIRVTIKTKMGIEKVKKDIPISLVGAVDRGYKESPSSGDYGNVYKNKASKFNLQCKHQSISTKYLIEKAEADEKYTLYLADNTKKTETSLYCSINNQGYLTTLFGEKFTLQIRPDVNQIYPGDDLLLLFMVEDKEYTVDPQDYIAVYDKKMLWRANQYIEEPEARLQNLDWNNAHPWNTNDSTIDWYGINDWLSDENGGQIPIQGWTRWNDSIEVNGSVAYGWGCNDTIIEFNNELRAQSDAIKKYKEENDKNGEISWDESSIHVYAPSREGDTVDSTTTEDIINDNLWENYVFPNKEILIKCDPILLKNRKMEDFFLTENMEISIPGLSTFWDENNKYEAGVHDKNTSGIDCSGLAGIANGIKDKVSTRYFAGQINKGTDSNPKWEDDPNAKVIRMQDETWIIDDKEVSEKRDKQRKLLSYAVPGDILVKGGDHVVIIRDLDYEGNNSVITSFSQIDVIHSTEGLLTENLNQEWRVLISNANEVSSLINQYQLRRITMMKETEK